MEVERSGAVKLFKMRAIGNYTNRGSQKAVLDTKEVVWPDVKEER